MRQTFCQTFLSVSLFSTIYSKIGVFPSLSGGLQLNVNEFSVLSEVISGPVGGEGLSVGTKEY